MKQIKIDVVKQWCINAKAFSVQEIIEELEQENAKLKEKLKSFENGEVAWQGNMDATIKQNIELKTQIEKIVKIINMNDHIK